MTAHTHQPPAPALQQQQTAAAAPPDRHRQHPRQQRGSLKVVEPDSAVQSATQQQQVHLLQRNVGSRPDQAETAPQAFLAAQPEQTAAGETPEPFDVQLLPAFTSISWRCQEDSKHFCDQPVAAVVLCLLLSFKAAHHGYSCMVLTTA